MNFNLSCAVALYSLCYPIIKSCNYWNYNSSLPTIVDKGKKTYRKSSLAHNQQSPVNLPTNVDVHETKVNWDNLFKSEGLLTDSLQSKSIRENEIIHNSECTGTEKKLMTKHYRKKKQYCKAMEPAEKKHHWRKNNLGI